MSKKPNDNFNDILDDAKIGNAPSEGYLERLDIFDSVIREAMHISKKYSGIKSPTSQHYYASVLYTTLITRSVSLMCLAPHSTWSEKIIEHWDYASAAVITRTILEIRLCFYYLCIDECDREEWECRWNILNVHDCSSRIRLLEAQGSTEGIPRLECRIRETSR